MKQVEKVGKVDTDIQILLLRQTCSSKYLMYLCLFWSGFWVELPIIITSSNIDRQGISPKGKSETFSLLLMKLFFKVRAQRKNVMKWKKLEKDISNCLQRELLYTSQLFNPYWIDFFKILFKLFLTLTKRKFWGKRREMVKIGLIIKFDTRFLVQW